MDIFIFKEIKENGYSYAYLIKHCYVDRRLKVDTDNRKLRNIVIIHTYCYCNKNNYDNVARLIKN